MKYALQNGWTKQRMLDAVNTHVPENGAFNLVGGCQYVLEGVGRCAAGAMLSDEHAALYGGFGGSTHELVAKARYDRVELGFPLGGEGMSQLQRLHDKEPHGARARVLAWIEANVE